MIPNSNTTKKDKAIISGHYIFSSKEFLELKNRILEKESDISDFDNFLKIEIRKSIIRYLKCLNII